MVADPDEIGVLEQRGFLKRGLLYCFVTTILQTASHTSSLLNGKERTTLSGDT
jgi:hypothetical protein